MLDVVIRDGVIVDGTGSPPYCADVGICNGIITEIGRINSEAHRTLKADGALLTPGFIDIHTHYDGQASWDETFSPSIYHGVTTVVMGNCGVGFAPVRPQDRDRLIDLMEQDGIIGPADGARPREILVAKDYFTEVDSRQQ